MVATDRKSTGIRVSNEAHRRFQDAAARMGVALTQYMEELSRREEERLFWTEVEESMARLKADPGAWADYKAEQAEWDTTLLDGLDDEGEEVWGGDAAWSGAGEAATGRDLDRGSRSDPRP
jgi:hypothetical protein